jgi:hypothetical protein
VQCEAIEAVVLGRTTKKGAHVFRKLVAVAHRRAPVGGFAGGFGFAWAGVVPGFAAAESAAGSINTPVAFSVTVTVLTFRSSKMMSMILPLT